jgi:hypothetical protein
MTACAKFLSNVCSGRDNLNTVHSSRTFASNGDYCLSATNEKGRVWCVLDEVNRGTIRLDRRASRRQAGVCTGILVPSTPRSYVSDVKEQVTCLTRT